MILLKRLLERRDRWIPDRETPEDRLKKKTWTRLSDSYFLKFEALFDDEDDDNEEDKEENYNTINEYYNDDYKDNEVKSNEEYKDNNDDADGDNGHDGDNDGDDSLMKKVTHLISITY